MTREEAMLKIGELVAYARTQGWDDVYTDAFKTLEQEPCNTDTCKVVKAYMNEWDKPNNADAISRQAYIERYRKWAYSEFGQKMGNGALAIRVAMSLPPVTPQPKTGHWERETFDLGDDLPIRVAYQCSECGEYFDGEFKFCPNCGAKLESEGKK